MSTDARNNSLEIGKDSPIRLNDVYVRFDNPLGTKTIIAKTVTTGGSKFLPWYDGKITSSPGDPSQHDFWKIAFVPPSYAGEVIQTGWSGASVFACGICYSSEVSPDSILSFAKSLAPTQENFEQNKAKILSVLNYLTTVSVLHYSAQGENVIFPGRTVQIGIDRIKIKETSATYSNAISSVKELDPTDFTVQGLIDAVCSEIKNPDKTWENDFIHAVHYADVVLIPKQILWRISNTEIIAGWKKITEPPLTGCLNDDMKGWFMVGSFGGKYIPPPIPPSSYKLYVTGDGVNFRASAGKGATLGSLNKGDILYQSGTEKSGWVECYCAKLQLSGFISSEFVSSSGASVVLGGSNTGTPNSNTGTPNSNTNTQNSLLADKALTDAKDSVVHESKTITYVAIAAATIAVVGTGLYLLHRR